MSVKTVLVTGSTGKTGRRVHRRLVERGQIVREASRSTTPVFDWQEPATWVSALDGVDAVYVVLPDLGAASAVATAQSFALQAAGAGVRTVVMVSQPAVGTAESATVADTENAFTDAGLALTALRLRWFDQNFSEDFLLDAVMANEIRVPAGDGREAFVDAEDIADVAVECLLDDTLGRRSLEVTGPAAVSFAEVANILGDVTGRSITYTSVSTEQFLTEQEASGSPAEWAHALAGLYATIAGGSLGSTSTDVEAVLGRPATSFETFAQANKRAWTG